MFKTRPKCLNNSQLLVHSSTLNHYAYLKTEVNALNTVVVLTFLKQV